MARTPRDLYRTGNKVSARLDHIRSIDVFIFDRAGAKWVKASTGGISTFDYRAPFLKGTIWRLPANTDYDEAAVLLSNTGSNHRLWEPRKDMPVDVYAAARAVVSAKFVP